MRLSDTYHYCSSCLRPQRPQHFPLHQEIRQKHERWDFCDRCHHQRPLQWKRTQLDSAYRDLFFLCYDSITQTKPKMDLKNTESQTNTLCFTVCPPGFAYKGAEKLTKERHNNAASGPTHMKTEQHKRMQMHSRVVLRCLSWALQDLVLHAVEGRENKYQVFEHDRTTVINFSCSRHSFMRDLQPQLSIVWQTATNNWTAGFKSTLEGESNS